MDTLRNIIKKHPIISFAGLTFLISWGIWIPIVLLQVSTGWYRVGTFGPTLAALVLIALRDGRKGYGELYRRLTRWKVPAGWYVFSIFSAVPVVLVSIWLHIALGGARPQFNDINQIYLVIPAFFYVLFTSVLGEEIGWRGWALPRLLEKQPPLASSLILAGIWGIWHLPLFMMKGNFHADIPVSAFLLQIIPFTIAYTAMHLNTEGSLILPHLFHAVSNTTLGVLPVLPMDTGGSTRPMWIALLLWCLIVSLYIIVVGPSLKAGKDLQENPAPH